jgi:plasmid stabilization system protein ParE
MQPTAKADYWEIFEYIEQRSPIGAEHWQAACEEALKRLANDPQTCGYAPENRRSKNSIRQALFKTKSGLMYRALFTIDGDEVKVHQIRGPGEGPVHPDELPLE